jgi:hypothetical protein
MVSPISLKDQWSDEKMAHHQHHATRFLLKPSSAIDVLSFLVLQRMLQKEEQHSSVSSFVIDRQLSIGDSCL